MQSHELEDLTLLLVRDADEAEMWIDRWALSYPTVRTAAVSRSRPIAEWQQAVGAAVGSIHSRNIAAVAHGAGISGWLSWLYLADVNMQKRIKNMILVSPRQDAFPDDADHTLQRVRCHCPSALVIGRNDRECPQQWAQQQAQLWGARLLAAPQPGRLNGHLNGWQWGMKLLQEMLLK
ncbi:MULTISPECIES: alpha/beta hydrolase [unclassified Neisseria]|uniref:alpha/beta hydrolase n=1 Tax=unclassified Neisseria TaxID=2623750 RepID=UPI0010727553|nr:MULTISPECIES: alpha/beta hydrolase [unclassified Neisseria]MBF0803673.1 alpha/beta hydrolase [Neisseria sp. 19428wB4_WF04]TFU43663.1 serine hydrolase [Neisseria sp. WF04]